MGRIARLKEFIRTIRHGINLTDVQADPGGGPNITAEHFASPGDDSYPMDNDFIALVTQDGNRESVVGYIDPKNLQKATKGDKRIYARDASGDQICEVWLKKDGTILLENDEVKHELKPDGESLIENSNGRYKLTAAGKLSVENAAVGLTLNPDGSAVLTNDSGIIELRANGVVSINGVLFSTDGNITVPGGISFASGGLIENGDFITDDKISLKNHCHEQHNDGAGDTEEDTETPTPTE